MESAHPLFGKCVFICEKFDPRTAVYKANGGLGGLLVFYLLLIPFISFIISVALGAGVLGMNVTPVDWNELGPIVAVVYVVMVILSPLAFKRNFAFAKGLSLRLYETGLVVEFPKHRLEKPYSEVTDVYFGNKSQVLNKMAAVTKYTNPAAAAHYKAVFDNRLTIECKDDPGIALMSVRNYVLPQSLDLFLEKLAAARETSK